MTDPTAARDRAIEVLWPHHGTREDLAPIVDALLARPEVLRALAGAPDATAQRRLDQHHATTTDWDAKDCTACAFADRFADRPAAVYYAPEEGTR